MIEYKLNIPAKHSTVKTIWRKFLQNDNTWHFTLEGDYIELRVAKKRKDLQDYFHLKKWDWSSFEYKDNVDITRKYQKQFEKIFHGFAELSMLAPKTEQLWTEKEWSEKFNLIERCVHLLFNIFGVGMGDEYMGELLLAVNRARYSGWWEAKAESNSVDKEEKKIKADKEG